MIRLPTHSLEWERIKQILDGFTDAGCGRVIRITNPGDTIHNCRLGVGDLVLVGQYLANWGFPLYWDLISRGGIAGYSLCLHELTEIVWYFEHFHQKPLDPYDKIPKQRPAGYSSLDQVEGYPKAHARALLVEHRYIQLRANEESQKFTLKELVLANPHGWDGFSGETHLDWVLLEQAYGGSLAAADCELDDRQFKYAQMWYEYHGFCCPS